MLQALQERTDDLAERRHGYLALFQYAPAAWLLTDQAGNVREANLAACQLLGRPWGHLVRRPLVMFVPRAERAALRDGITAALLGRTAAWRMAISPFAVQVRVRVCPQGLGWMLTRA